MNIEKNLKKYEIKSFQKKIDLNRNLILLRGFHIETELMVVYLNIGTTDSMKIGREKMNVDLEKFTILINFGTKVNFGAS